MSIFSRFKKDKEKQKPAVAKQAVNVVKKAAPRQIEVKKEPAAAISVEKKEFSGAWRSLRHPLVTEKAADLSARLNQYIFKVSGDTNKIEIKKAIQNLYGVKVEGVNIVNIHSKRRRVGKSIGTRPGYKKAIITLRQGDKIDSGV